MVGKKKVVACNCGYIDRKSEAAPLVEKVELKDEITVITETIESLPKMKQKCPECAHGEAYFWLQQTRAGDEPETRFFKCVKCTHTWREYS
jgi:DNA-directed RNA polymerase subunit M